jgi:hypothetical protein
MSGSAFARANGLNAQRLFWWRKQLNAEARTSVAPLTFVPAISSVAIGGRVLVRLPGGVEVEGPEVAALPATWVAALARELSGTP